jgi:hypothetical protein
MGVGDGGGLADLRRRQCESAGGPRLPAPQQERANGDALVLLVPGVPSIDLGLPAFGQGHCLLGEPTEEGGGVTDLSSGITAPGWGDGLAVRACAQLGQHVPGGKPPDDLLVCGIGDAGEPSLEQTDLFVHPRKQPAGHEQLAQVCGGPPGLELVERFVRGCDGAVSQAAQQLRRRRGVRRPALEPIEPGARVVHRDEQFVQGKQLRPDAAGAVVEQTSESGGQGAAGAEPTSVQLVFLAAA